MGSAQGKLNCEEAEKTYEAKCLAQDDIPRAQAQAELCVGNPVRPLSASKQQHEIDYTSGGEKSLTFSRHFGRWGGGLGRHGGVSRLGREWRSNYDAVIKLDGVGAIDDALITLPDGREVAFVIQSGLFVPAYVSLKHTTSYLVAGRKGVVDRLEVVSGNYELHDRDDTVWVFSPASKLIAIREPGGYVRELQYDSLGNNTLVTDSFGRQLAFTYDADGMLTQMTAPGGTYTYDYAQKGGIGFTAPPGGWRGLMREWTVLTTVTRPDAKVRTYHYENPDHVYALTGITDERNIRYATFAYDAEGRALSSEHSGGADRHTLVYDDAAGKVTVSNPLSKETVYDYTDDAQYNRLLTAVIGEPSPHCPLTNSTLAYDANNFLSAVVDEEGRRTEMVNDARGLPTTVTRAVGRPEQQTTTYAWHPDYRRPTQVAAPGLTTAFAYDALGNVTSAVETDTTTHTVPYVTAGQTRGWTYTYTTGGLLDTVDGPLPGAGDLVDYDYDPSGNLDRVTDELGHVTDVLAVNARGQPTSLVDANGKGYTLAYDVLGRLIKVTADLGWAQRVTTIAYDAIGQVARVTLPDASYVRYSYTNARRLSLMETNTGERIEYTHDLMGNAKTRKVKVAGAVIESQSRTFDELGRMLSTIGAAAQTWTRGYDKVGNLVSVTDPRQNLFGAAFDGLNRLIGTVDEEGAPTTLARNAAGEVAAHTDPNAVATTYVRNGWGEVIREASPDIGTVDYVRNALGLVTKKTDGRGVVAQYAYDDAGRQTALVIPAGTAENAAFAYDETTAGNLGRGMLTSVDDESGSTRFAYDMRPGVASVETTIGSRTYTVAYDYDAAGRLNEIVYPSGRGVSFWYDAAGRPAGIATRKNATLAYANLGVDLASRPFTDALTAITHANNVEEWRTLDADGRVAAHGATLNGTDLLRRSLAYGDGINLTAMTDQLDASRSETYSYGPANRLAAASGPWGAFTIATDGVGNRTGQTRTSGGVTTSEVYNRVAGSNRLLDIFTGGVRSRSFTYDSGGNLRFDTKSGVQTAYTYSRAGRLASLTVGGSARGPYLYNAFGQLASRTVTSGVPASAIAMLYDRDGNLIAEANAVTGVTMREYIWLTGRPVAVVKDVDTANPVLSHVHVDHLDRPVLMTSATGTVVWRAVYQPFGTVHAITGPASFDHRFPGQWFMLETGLHTNWHRWYDSSLGRYTQPDPLGLVDGPSRYAYAANSPLMHIDPTGLEEYPDQFIGPLPPSGYHTSEMSEYISPLTGATCGRVPPGPPGSSIIDNMAAADASWNPFWFRDQVRNKGPWDYKQKRSKYEDFGNFNFGASGRAMGFPQSVLQRAAGYASQEAEFGRTSLGSPFGRFPYGDDPKDQSQIVGGVEFCRCIGY